MKDIYSAERHARVWVLSRYSYGLDKVAVASRHAGPQRQSVDSWTRYGRQHECSISFTNPRARRAHGKVGTEAICCRLDSGGFENGQEGEG
jgi:hypothetical protein